MWRKKFSHVELICTRLNDEYEKEWHSRMREIEQSSKQWLLSCCSIRLYDIKYGISIWLIWWIYHKVRKKYDSNTYGLTVNYAFFIAKTVLLYYTQFSLILCHLSTFHSCFIKTYVCSAFHAVLNSKSISWIIKLFNLAPNPATFNRTP